MSLTPDTVRAAKVRRDLVTPYARAILRVCFQAPPDVVNVTAINRAILKRWSVSGLIWIKREAWKEAERISKAGA